MFLSKRHEPFSKGEKEYADAQNLKMVSAHGPLVAISFFIQFLQAKSDERAFIKHL